MSPLCYAVVLSDESQWALHREVTAVLRSHFPAAIFTELFRKREERRERRNTFFFYSKHLIHLVYHVQRREVRSNLREVKRSNRQRTPTAALRTDRLSRLLFLVLWGATLQLCGPAMSLPYSHGFCIPRRHFWAKVAGQRFYTKIEFYITYFLV